MGADVMEDGGMGKELGENGVVGGIGQLPSEVFANAANLIEPEGAWCQGPICITEDGLHHDDIREGAVCWCAIGAIVQQIPGLSVVEQREYSALAENLLDLSQFDGKCYPLGNWNDAPERAQAEVVAALRKASELAKAEGL